MKFWLSIILVIIGFLIGYFIWPKILVRPEATVELSDSEPGGDIKEEMTESVDPYSGWSTLEVGGTISLRIPPGCKVDSGAGNRFIFCPTESAPTPPPDMVISSDGVTVNVRRWEDFAWEYWDRVIESIQIITPLKNDITINVQK